MIRDNSLVYLGRVLGTSMDWDGEMEYVIFYNFVPHPSVSGIPGGVLSVDTNSGVVMIRSKDDELLYVSYDMAQWLARFPKMKDIPVPDDMTPITVVDYGP